MPGTYNKTAITITQQIQTLKQRGLIVDDDIQAAKVLEVISYFRLADYWRFMEADPTTHQFKEGSRFEYVVNCYNFDKELKTLLFSAIQTLEVAMRAKMIKHFTSSFGAFWFMNPTLSSNSRFFTTNLEHIRTEVSRSREDFIIEHFQKYASPELPPVWKTLEVVSLGTLSKMYTNFNDATAKHLVARDFGLNHHKFLSSWVETLSVLRNCCAHHARVWNKCFPIMPQMPARMPKPWINNRDFPRASFYPQVCCIAYWLNNLYSDHSFPVAVKALFKKYPTVKPYLMGFPEGWENEPLWA